MGGDDCLVAQNLPLRFLTHDVILPSTSGVKIEL